MPSAMIHLCTAKAFLPTGSAAFHLGCIAPDYAFERAYKDRIHLRDVPDRALALAALARRLDRGDAFSLGWLLHLYTDLCWDNGHLADYRARHEADADWFRGYHSELHAAGYALYHAHGWAEGCMREMEALPLDDLPSALEIDPKALAFFREVLFEKTRESDPQIASAAFPPALTEAFAAETAAGFRRWLREAGL